MKKKNVLSILLIAAFLATISVGSANAMSFKHGENVTIDCDVTLSWGGKMRIAEPKLIGLAGMNADDGNQNFDDGDLVNNRFAAIADVDINYQGDFFTSFGVFARPRAFYDFVYEGGNAKYDTMANPNQPRSLGDNFPDDVEDIHGSDIDVLDLFVYASFDIGDRSFDFRFGEQCVQWGEALKFSGISGAMSHADYSAAFAPGVRVAEILLPEGQVFGQVELNPNMSIAGYYKYDWQKHILFESGSFFSTADMLDEAGNTLFVAPGVGFTKTADRDPDSDDQYGVAFMMLLEELNATEIGLYYCNYHSSGLSFVVSPPNYYLDFAEDIKMYGVSFSTLLGDWSILGEASYHDGIYAASTVTGPGAPSRHTRAEYLQYNLAGIWAARIPFPYLQDLCSRFSIAWEVVGVKLIDADVDKDVVTASDFAWGYYLSLTPLWIAVMPGLDITMPMNATIGAHGNAVNAKVSEHADSYSIGLAFEYLSVWKAKIEYVDYTWQNSRKDRDWIGVQIERTF